MAVLDMAGIWLMVIGAILAFFAIAGVLPGKKKIGGAIALVFIVAGLVLAGPMIGGLLAVAPTVADGVPVYDVRFGAFGFEDNADDETAFDGCAATAGAVILAADFKSMDVLCGGADLDGAGTHLLTIIDVEINRLDPGDADDTAIVYMDVGTVATIVDVTAGTTFPLIDFNIQTDSFDFTWTPDLTDVAIGFLTGSKYYDSFAPGDFNAYDVDIGFNEAGYVAGADVIGVPYSLTLVAAGQTLTISIVSTS